MKYKYAYPYKNNLIISEKALPIKPFFNEEIEIIKLTKNKLIGNLVHYENTKISHDIEVSEVRKEYCELRPKYIFFGKKIIKPKHGWIKLKKVTKVELNLSNRIVTYVKGDKK